MSVKVASDEYKRLKKEVSRMSSMANKRLDRLSKNGLQDSPAFKAWESGGSIRFSVKGKNYQQLQSEYWRLKNFINAQSSTVKGANALLKEIANNTGIKYGSVKELKSKTKNFFAIADKIKEYNKTIGNTAQALDYQKIWQLVNQYVQQNNIDLASVDSVETALDGLLVDLGEVEPIERNAEGFKDGGSTWDFIDL